MSLTDNLAAYWKFEGNSNSEVNSNNGTDSNITYGSSYGKISQGADFNGSNGRISVADSASLSITGTNLSISLWVRPDALPSNNTIVNLVNKLDSNLTGYNISLFNDNGTQKVSLSFAGTGNSAIQDHYVSLDLGTGTWKHLVVTWDGSGTNSVKYYVDGSNVANASDTKISSIGDGVHVFMIGAFGLYSGSDIGRYFNGSLDEIGVWSRALSSTEITTLYNSGSGLTYPFSTTAVKSVNGLAKASVKSKNGLAIASIKSFNGLA